MSNYSSLKATINANVKTNGNQEITGQVMNAVLNAMVNSLGSGYQYMGIATPTNPGTNQTPDDRCFYIATTPGTYSHLGGLVVNDGEVAILKYDSAWSKEVTGAATAAQVTQLGQKVNQSIKDLDNSFGQDVQNLAKPLEGSQSLAYSDVQTGKYIASDGTFVSNPNWNIYRYDVSNIPCGYVTGRSSTAANAPFAALYDENDTFIKAFGIGVGGTITDYYIPFAGAKYLRVNAFQTNPFGVVPIITDNIAAHFDKNDNAIATNHRSILKIADDHEGDSLTPLETGVGYIGKNGSIQSGTQWTYKKYDVSNISIVYVTGRSAAVSAAAAFYDANDSLIGTINYGAAENYTNLCVLVPYGAAYLRVSHYNTNGTPDAKEYVTWPNTLPTRNNLAGKKVAFIGDSITAGGTETAPTNKLYHKIFADKYGCTNKNLGVWSTCIAENTSNGESANRFVTRATAANLSDCSLIVVFGGTNDFSYDIKPIGNLFNEETITPSGNIGDKKLVAPTDTETFAGALHELITTIRTNAPTIPIVFMTPLKRGRYNSSNPISGEKNIRGDYMEDFVDAIKKICAFYSIPVFDCNGISELDFTNDNIAALYSSDKLHPNIAGHKLLGELLFRFVENNVYIG